MPNIRIKREHSLKRDEAKAKVEQMAKDLEDKLGASYHWEGDCLCFSRSGASGSIDVKDKEVEVNVKLGLMLAPMKGMIERSINEGFDGALSGTGKSRLA